MSSVIKVENLSKAYQLGQIGTGTLSRDLERWWALKRGKEDPFLKIGEANDRTSKGTSNVVWSLKDINFEIKQGDAVGIIGRNGAGKSTLLKILSRVTAPTTGQIKVKGRIASLLEVGTGFHPELTGKENIFLNGAILGMRRREIQKKFDEIVDFAGIERYVDTPVKRYSSGMYVRLAFAVAAHLESEILVVDEVLAVGDAEFQKRCLNKMNDVSKGQGKTVLFVSHNMDAVISLTDKALYLKNGLVQAYSDTPEIVSKYQSDRLLSNFIYKNAVGNEIAYIEKISIKTTGTNNYQLINSGFDIQIELIIKKPLKKPAISYQIVDSNNTPLIHNLIVQDEVDFGTQVGRYFIVNHINKLKLYPGKYSLIIHFAESQTKEKLETIANVCDFEVVLNGDLKDYYWKPGSAKFIQDNVWDINFIKN